MEASLDLYQRVEMCRMCCAFLRHLCYRWFLFVYDAISVLTQKLLVSCWWFFISVLSHLFCKLRRPTTGQLQAWVPLLTSNLYRSASEHFVLQHLAKHPRLGHTLSQILNWSNIYIYILILIYIYIHIYIYQYQSKMV